MCIFEDCPGSDFKISQKTISRDSYAIALKQTEP
jgi:hypothetical protein